MEKKRPTAKCIYLFEWRDVTCVPGPGPGGGAVLVSVPKDHFAETGEPRKQTINRDDIAIRIMDGWILTDERIYMLRIYGLHGSSAALFTWCFHMRVGYCGRMAVWPHASCLGWVVWCEGTFAAELCAHNYDRHADAETLLRIAIWKLWSRRKIVVSFVRLLVSWQGCNGHGSPEKGPEEFY